MKHCVSCQLQEQCNPVGSGSSAVLVTILPTQLVPSTQHDRYQKMQTVLCTQIRETSEHRKHIFNRTNVIGARKCKQCYVYKSVKHIFLLECSKVHSTTHLPYTIVMLSSSLICCSSRRLSQRMRQEVCWVQTLINCCESPCCSWLSFWSRVFIVTSI